MYVSRMLVGAMVESGSKKWPLFVLRLSLMFLVPYMKSSGLGTFKVLVVHDNCQSIKKYASMSILKILVAVYSWNAC